MAADPKNTSPPPTTTDTLARACNLAGVDYQTFLKIKAYMPVAAQPSVRRPVPEEPGPCPTCGEDEPRTGACGTSPDDRRALCNRALVRQQGRCYLCDCTGDVHSVDGEWRGECPYCNPSEKDPCPHCRTVLGWLVSNEEGDDAFVNNASALAGRHYKGGDPIALGKVLDRTKSLPEERTDYAVHLNHCNIGECGGVCKYGDDDCPALAHAALKQQLRPKGLD